jgi:ATP-dependent RNA helicase RhlE
LSTQNIQSFAELPLHADVRKVLEEEKYVTPTPIQAQAIPPIIEGRDVLGTAQTGTGKTAAFALPIIDRIHKARLPFQSRAPQVLILSPTRELACQIGESLRTYGRHTRVRQTVIYGGVGQGPQVQALRHGVHILVATPGRLQDLMSQGHVRLDDVKVLVLDEADQMCDMGFLPDLKRIVAKLPAERQSLFFSATMPSTVSSFAQSLLTDPVRVSVAPASATTERVEQRVLMMQNPQKRATMNRLLEDPSFNQVLVFVRTKRRADVVTDQLRDAGVTADSIHGDKTQSMRTRALLQFRTGRIRVLVATDVAARGIDIDGISHVINYDMPGEPEAYVHRIGRTGRAGAEGIAITFCCPEDRGSLRAIERTINLTLDKRTISGEPVITAPPRDRQPRPAGNVEQRAARTSEQRGPREGGRPAGRFERRPAGAFRSEQRPGNDFRGRDDRQRSQDSSGGQGDGPRRRRRPASAGSGR